MTNTRPPDSPLRLLQKSLLCRGVSFFSITAMILSMGAARSQEASEAALDNPGEPVPTRLEPTVEAAPSLREQLPAVSPIDSGSDFSSSPLDPGESYIDSTTYSIGATERSHEQPRVVRLPEVPAATQVGPLTVNSYGLAFGTTPPKARDYYYRSLRPPGRLGNGNIRLIFPLSIPAPITSLFGWRLHPITGEQRFHSGTDLAAPIGTPVLAAYAGQVALADFLGGYGLTVLLEHNKSTQQTLYAHLSEIFVKPGEWVSQGSVIGRVGNTGMSTGPHLHFEFHQQTPEGWVAQDAGEQLEYALAQLMKTMGVARLPAAPAPTETLQLDLSTTLDVNLQKPS